MTTAHNEIVQLPAGGDLWEQVFVVAPLVLVGTVEADGRPDLAPKHQAMPLGWTDSYGFVCTGRHSTHRNALRTSAFTVSYPRPDQVVLVGQSAAPRVGSEKPSLAALPTFPASQVTGVLLEGAALWLECELDRVVGGFGEHDLIVGRIVSASAPRSSLRDPDVDDADLLSASPPLAFLSPTRFAAVSGSRSFPFPLDFSR